MPQVGVGTESDVLEEIIEKINYVIGDMVRVRGLNESGPIINIDKKSNNVIIDINNKKLSVQIDQLTQSNKKNIQKQSKNSIARYNIETLDSQRLDLRGMRVDEALLKLDIFLDSLMVKEGDLVEKGDVLFRYKFIELNELSGTRVLKMELEEKRIRELRDLKLKINLKQEEVTNLNSMLNRLESKFESYKKLLQSGFSHFVFILWQ